MKASEISKQYIWLTDTIYRSGGISFQELNERWIRTEMSGGLPMSRTTFNRHREAILGLNLSDRQYWLVDKSVMSKRKEPTQPATPSTDDEAPATDAPLGQISETVREFKSFKISKKVPVEQWTQLFSCFIVPLKKTT